MCVSGLEEDKDRKYVSDLVIEKSVALFGFTPDEKSDRNRKWMQEHGYLIKHRRGRPGHPKRSDSR